MYVSVRPSGPTHEHADLQHWASHCATVIMKNQEVGLVEKDSLDLITWTEWVWSHYPTELYSLTDSYQGCALHYQGVKISEFPVSLLCEGVCIAFFCYIFSKLYPYNAVLYRTLSHLFLTGWDLFLAMSFKCWTWVTPQLTNWESDLTFN